MYFDSYSFGRRVREIRKSLGKTQKELSMDLNITGNTLSYIEHGKRTPSIDLVIEIASNLNVSLDYLVLGSENPNMKDIRKELAEALKHLNTIHRLSVPSEHQKSVK